MISILKQMKQKMKMTVGRFTKKWVDFERGWLVSRCTVRQPDVSDQNKRSSNYLYYKIDTVLILSLQSNYEFVLMYLRG